MAAVRSKEGGVVVNKRKVNRHDASKSATTRPEAHDARDRAVPKLPKPLGPKARRIITKKTSTLMRKRNKLDRALLLQAFRPVDELSVNYWLPREEVLRQCERMASRERDYIRARTKALEERTALYNQDPSEERALDLNLIRAQLWRFKRHLGPYLEAAEEPREDGEDDVSSSDSDSDSSDDESELVQDKADDSTSSVSSEGDPSNGNVHDEKPSIGLDGAFDDIRNSKKRRRNDVSETRKESQKRARKEQTSGSTQSATSQSQSSKAAAPKRSKEMEDLLSQILNNMSQTKSSEVSINGASKVESEEGPAEATTTKGTSEKANRTAPKTPASSSNSNASDGDVRPWYQRHAKAMLRPDFDDCVRERPHRNRRGPNSKQKRREYLVSGALPVPHLPSPRPNKARARSASTDGP
ncbi:hypothetical protein INS49_010281 [Diaporthe citri]|uniref:uncharacterized protein n=1 Tax=Diaporthe citri TaxID=83186 RepID=UPI001C800B4A|nr:uncharacterized protein INS49_010281 [Diaporthe citri]KAG6362052.1 hypothetical protein INS49_010281 [Diaporthe citri]